MWEEKKKVPGNIYEKLSQRDSFLVFVVCDENGDDGNDDVFIGFRMRETLVCI